MKNGTDFPALKGAPELFGDMRIIVHGGAGGSPDDPAARQAVLDEAATSGVESTTTVDAVESAIRVLESDAKFNAGVGGAVQSDGIVRTDAGIMCSDRSAGAACSMPGVEHAVSVARIVLEETPHVLVSGVHAVDLAADMGIETERELRTDDKRKQFEEASAPSGTPGGQLGWIREQFGSADEQAGERGDGGSKSHTRSAESPDDAKNHDTVGAVAHDGDRFAAATSTAGRSFALAGRVGDVPQIGSGFFCTPSGGASATGAGEDIARVTLSRRAVSHLESGLDAQTAADRAIEEFEDITGSGAGIIVLDESSVGSAYNTDLMQTSVALDR